MSTKTTITERTPDTVRPHMEDHAAHRGRAYFFAWVIAIAVIAAALVDTFIFAELLNAQAFSNDPITNAVLSVILSAGPVVLATVAALGIDAMRTRKNGTAGSIIILICLITFEALYFAWLFSFRHNAIQDDVGLANVLNTVAVMFTVAAFVVHLMLSRKRSLHLKAADILEQHIDFNNNARGYIACQHISDIDSRRRQQDWRDFTSAFKQIPDTVIENMRLSRDACSKLYAQTDTQARLAQDLPIKIKNQAYDTIEKAREAINEYIGPPTDSDYYRAYGPETNSGIARQARDAAAKFKTRYQDIINKYPGIDI